MTDIHALSSCQAIGLDDYWHAMLLQVRLCSLHISEGLVAGGGDVMVLTELLRGHAAVMLIGMGMLGICTLLHSSL